MNRQDLLKEVESLHRRVVELEARLNSNEAEAEGLRASDGRYRQAIDVSPGPIIAIDPAGRSVSWNRASTEMSGCTLRQIWAVIGAAP